MNNKDTYVSIITLTNYLTLLNSERSTFYAADLGFSGAEVNAMHNLEMIAPTGETKPVFVQHPYKEDLYRKFDAKQWKVIPLKEWIARHVVEDVNKLADLVNGYNALCAM